MNGSKSKKSARRLLTVLWLMQEAAFPLQVAADYAIYRLMLAGRLRPVKLPSWLRFTALAVQWLLSLALLPIIGLVCFSLIAAVAPVGAAALAAVAAVCAVFVWMRRFRLAWGQVQDFDTGTARKLRGTCLVFHVYAGKKWPEKRRREALARATAGCRWLEEQAVQHKMPLAMIADGSDLLVLDDLGYASKELQYPRPWIAYSAQKNTLASSIEAAIPRIEEAVRERLKQTTFRPDNTLVIVHAPQSHVGYAVPVGNDVSRETDLEFCVCGDGFDPASYAHEILHLFGAPDLYLHPWRIMLSNRGLQGASRTERRLYRCAAAVYRARFEGSIMYSTHGGLGKSRIDPITARSIGWRRPDPEYLESMEKLRAIPLELAGHMIERADELTRRRS